MGGDSVEMSSNIGAHGSLEGLEEVLSEDSSAFVSSSHTRERARYGEVGSAPRVAGYSGHEAYMLYVIPRVRGAGFHRGIMV